MMQGLFKKIFKLINNNIELIFWTMGLIYLFINSLAQTDLSFCPVKHLGFNWCPGCGLGKSISYLFNFQIINSLKTHPLGIFALIVISYRILTLIKNIRRERNVKYT